MATKAKKVTKSQMKKICQQSQNKVGTSYSDEAIDQMAETLAEMVNIQVSKDKSQKASDREFELSEKLLRTILS